MECPAKLPAKRDDPIFASFGSTLGMAQFKYYKSRDFNELRDFFDVVKRSQETANEDKIVENGNRLTTSVKGDASGYSPTLPL